MNLKRILIAVLGVASAVGGTGLATSASAGNRSKSADGGSRDYVVVYAQDADLGAARQAVTDAGGRIVSENKAIGVATVSSSDGQFQAKAEQQDALVGAVRNKAIGRVPAAKRKRDSVESLGKGKASAKKPAKGGARTEPLSPFQWDMRMIGATPDGS